MDHLERCSPLSGGDGGEISGRVVGDERIYCEQREALARGGWRQGTGKGQGGAARQGTSEGDLW